MTFVEEARGYMRAWLNSAHNMELVSYLNTACNTIETLERELAEARERNLALEGKFIEHMNRANVNAAGWSEAEAALAALREAFARYARHDDDCGPWAGGCRCGYAADRDAWARREP